MLCCPETPGCPRGTDCYSLGSPDASGALVTGRNVARGHLPSPGLRIRGVQRGAWKDTIWAVTEFYKRPCSWRSGTLRLFLRSNALSSSDTGLMGTDKKPRAQHTNGVPAACCGRSCSLKNLQEARGRPYPVFVYQAPGGPSVTGESFIAPTGLRDVSCGNICGWFPSIYRDPTAYKVGCKFQSICHGEGQVPKVAR